jgi:hypothetical protein
MTKKAKSKRIPCTCCSLLHDPAFCSQCIAAGCNHKGKNDPCQQSADVRKLATLPEWKVREDLAALQAEHAKLVDESQRLTRIVYQIDPKLLEQRGAPIPAAAEGAQLHG